MQQQLRTFISILSLPAAVVLTMTTMTSASTVSGSGGTELTENIHYMKLVHELKAKFPFVPDEYVKQVVEQVRL